MNTKSPEAIITDEGESPFRAQRAATAAWRPVGCRLPRPPAAATRTPRRASGPGPPLRGLAPALIGGPAVPVPPEPDLVGTADPPPRPPHLWCSAGRATAAGGLPQYYIPFG